MYIIFQMRRHFVQYQDHPKTKKGTRHKGFELATPQITQIVFIFLESNISFDLK